jgi:hypothetical protein
MSGNDSAVHVGFLLFPLLPGSGLQFHLTLPAIACVLTTLLLMLAIVARLSAMIRALVMSGTNSQVLYLASVGLAFVGSIDLRHSIKSSSQH